MDTSFFLSFLVGREYFASNSGLALSMDFNSFTDANALALGFNNPNLPLVAGSTAVQIVDSYTIGYYLIALSISALVVFLYFWNQKKGVVKNELS